MTKTVPVLCWEKVPVLWFWRSSPHAKERGAQILAELVGYGATSDAYHITSPLEDGSGAAKAMTLAMEEAGVQPEEVEYINAHGTGTASQ